MTLRGSGVTFILKSAGQNERRCEVRSNDAHEVLGIVA